VLDALGSEAREQPVEPSDGEGDPARARPRRVDPTIDRLEQESLIRLGRARRSRSPPDP
jgi:hypothetical protein